MNDIYHITSNMVTNPLGSVGAWILKVEQKIGKSNLWKCL